MRILRGKAEERSPVWGNFGRADGSAQEVKLTVSLNKTLASPSSGQANSHKSW
jgi:hypothetical protein